MNRPELERRSAAFAVRVFRLAELIRKHPGGFSPANQLQRASSSIAANYRASGRGRSPDEFIAKIGTCNEEADEAVYWLEHVRDTHLAGGDEFDRLLREAEELRAIFAASYGTARRNQKKRREQREAKKRRTGNDQQYGDSRS